MWRINNWKKKDIPLIKKNGQDKNLTRGRQQNVIETISLSEKKIKPSALFKGVIVGIYIDYRQRIFIEFIQCGSNFLSIYMYLFYESNTNVCWKRTENKLIFIYFKTNVEKTVWSEGSFTLKIGYFGNEKLAS